MSTLSVFIICVKQLRAYLGETTLIIQYAQYPMRLCCNEVQTLLVVVEELWLPSNLLPHVLLLQNIVKHMTAKFIG